jgi:gas vesicle structural protein
MTVATQSINRAPRPSSLADVLEVVLDKGIVIDAYVRVAVVGIELLTIDARIVIASVDTYLRFAEAVNRLDLQPDGQVSGLPGMMEEITEGGAASKTKGALTGAADKARDAISSVTGDEDEDEEEEAERPRRRPAKKTAAKRTSSSRTRSGSSRRRREG